jgi:hypothetical protein
VRPTYTRVAFGKIVDLVGAEREIKIITADGADLSQRLLLQIKSEITALLGTDELVVLAIEDWSRQLALSHDIKKVGQLNETETRALSCRGNGRVPCKDR